MLHVSAESLMISNVETNFCMLKCKERFRQIFYIKTDFTFYARSLFENISPSYFALFYGNVYQFYLELKT